MKKLIIAALLFPFVSFASTVTVTSDAHSSVTPSGSVVVPIGVTQTFSPFVSSGYVLSSVTLDGVDKSLGPVDVLGDAFDHTISVASVAASASGGAMPYCSGPMAPGWNVSLAGGGCGSSENYVQFGKILSTGDVCEFYYGCMDRR